ncbi:12472_t:CDS:2, partial [Gigaspora margarita]
SELSENLNIKSYQNKCLQYSNEKMEIDTDTESIQSDTTEIAELVEIINLLQGENDDLKLLIRLLEAIIIGLIKAASCIKSGLIEIIEEAVNVTNMISPVFPIAALINNVFTIHENVRLNEKISKSTIDRIASAEAAIKFLKIQKIKHKEKSQNLQYQELS